MEDYIKEVQLSRDLARKLQDHIEVLPKEVQEAYNKLMQHYQYEIEQGIQ